MPWKVMDYAIAQMSHHREQDMDFQHSHPPAPASPSELSSSGYSRRAVLSPDPLEQCRWPTRSLLHGSWRLQYPLTANELWFADD